jgi:rhodanese-related sulfurtransferase
MKPGNFLRILLLTLVLAGYSAWLSAVRPGQPPGDRIAPASSIAAENIPLLRLADLESLWQKPSTLFLDVRPLTDYEFGHIQGAISLPEEDFDERFPALRSRLEKAKALIVYCQSVDCGKSLWTAMRLRQAGLNQTMIYPAGWNEWINNDKPVTRLRQQ